MMLRRSLVIVTFASLCYGTTSFSANSPRNPQTKLLDVKPAVSRRNFFSDATALLTASAAWGTSSTVATAQDQDTTGANTEDGGVTLFKTPSGLKYIELREGTGPSPQYGQLTTISYSAYVKLPNKNKEKFDSAVFLLKHGNGRTIAGLDEGLHTMKQGGMRRIIIPPKLGFVDIGLGPLPAAPWDRWRLNKLLDDMVAVRNGDLIFDVELKGVIDDEADQGYYQDGSLTPEQFNTLRNNLQEKVAKAAQVGNAEVPQGMDSPPTV